MARKSEAKQVVLTGATRGCGRAMALAFAARGHTVYGCGRSAAGVVELQAELPPPHDFAIVDVASDEAVARWAERVIERAGAPDLVLNNAALINRNAPLWEVPAAELSALVDVNIKGPINVIRHFVPAMIARGEGVIVNFSSGWGRSTSAEVAPYCASKWAIEGLSKALADELPRGLASIPLNPGVINTEMLRSCFGASASAYPDAEQWAERAVPYLLSLGPQHNGKSLSV